MLFIQAAGPEKVQPTAALNPPAAFVFGSNSCEMNGRGMLIRAKMGQNPKQMSLVPPLECCRSPLVAATGRGRSGTEIKGLRNEQSAQM